MSEFLLELDTVIFSSTSMMVMLELLGAQRLVCGKWLNHITLKLA